MVTKTYLTSNLCDSSDISDNSDSSDSCDSCDSSDSSDSSNQKLCHKKMFNPKLFFF